MDRPATQITDPRRNFLYVNVLVAGFDFKCEIVQ